MAIRVPTLDTAAVERERRGLRARLRGSTDEPSIDRLTRLVHEAVDRGLPDEALAIVPSELTTDPGAGLAWALCRAHWDAGNRSDVRALALRHVDAITTAPVEAKRVVVRAAWTGALAGVADPPLAEALDQIRAEVRERQGPTSLVADLAHLDAYTDLVHSAALPRALARAGLAAELYAFVGEPGPEVKARILLARTDAIAGRLQSSAQNARRAVERARATADPRLLVQSLNALGIALFRRGEWTETERCLVRADELALAFGENRWRVPAQLHLARLLTARGDVARAEGVLRRIDPDALGLHAVPVQAVFDEYQGMVRLARGDAEGAMACYDRALERIDAAGVVSYERSELHLRRAEALLRLERFAAAHAECGRGLDGIEATGQWLERGQLLRIQALAAEACGRPRESVEARDRAERALRHTGDQAELARCLFDRARSSAESSERRRHAAAEAGHLVRTLGLEVRACEAYELEAEVAPVADEESVGADLAGSFGPDLVAVSSSMRSLLRELVTAAASDAPVLLQGETGTGKEVLARALHDRSGRADAPFVPVNCAAIPESLFEREFFGHARGAFTGADRDAPGLVEAAAGGTLFLDEIGEMPASVQPKLLRLLQEGTFRRVGEVRERSVDLRIVAATNRPLFELSQEGEFREDLYYRLSWFELGIPPLRERPDDVEALARSFLDREGRRVGRTFRMERSAWRALRRFAWPGNVRQLESAVASACARAGEDGRVRVADLPVHVRQEVRATRERPTRDVDLHRSLERYERELILDALRRSGHRRTEAARRLGIGRNTLYEKMKRLGIRPESPGRVA